MVFRSEPRHAACTLYDDMNATEEPIEIADDPLLQGLCPLHGLPLLNTPDDRPACRLCWQAEQDVCGDGD